MIQDCGMPVLIEQVNRFPGSGGAKHHRPPLSVPPLRVAAQFVPQAKRPTGIAAREGCDGELGAPSPLGHAGV
jgi:hypothetical protein